MPTDKPLRCTYSLTIHNSQMKIATALVTIGTSLLATIFSPQAVKGNISESYSDKCKYFYEDDYCITPKGRVFGKVSECGFGGNVQVGALGRDYRYYFAGSAGC